VTFTNIHVWARSWSLRLLVNVIHLQLHNSYFFMFLKHTAWWWLTCTAEMFSYLKFTKMNQYSETNMMHFLFNSVRIKGLYMFQALLAHPQEAPNKRHLVYCVRVMSVDCTRIEVFNKILRYYNKVLCIHGLCIYCRVFCGHNRDNMHCETFLHFLTSSMHATYSTNLILLNLTVTISLEHTNYRGPSSTLEYGLLAILSFVRLSQYL
jgi:hypothetical protein